MPQIFLRIAFVFGLALFGFQAANAAEVCTIDGVRASADNPACRTAPSNGDQSTIIGVSGEKGARSNAGVKAHTPIDKFGYCRYVDNKDARDHFVPFNSADEWSSFRLKYPTQYLYLNHCARPFSGNQGSLHFGPTSKREDMGDSGDSPTASVSLPYWRTGEMWPPGGMGAYTHNFNHSCYEEYVQEKCWNWVSKTCTACDQTDFFGNCIASHEYDCSYCADTGSTCEKRWTGWSETWGFQGLALDSDSTNPSWQGSSGLVGGSTRPNAQCTTRCRFDGHDCLDCGGTPAVSGACSIPAQVPPNYTCYLAYVGQNVGTTTSIAIIMIQIQNAENAIASALAAGNCPEALSTRATENTGISWANDICIAWASQYVQQQLAD